MTTVMETHLDLPLKSRGKVRDVYDLGDRLLIVATDRLSAFDVVFREGIPGKGKVLTEVSLFWAETLPSCSPYHLITADVTRMGPKVAAQAEVLAGRTMLVEKLDMLPVECVVRGALVGSGWKEYQATGKVCGQTLPKGLALADRIDPPIFTPATKAEQGDHDENISFERMIDIVGRDDAIAARERALAIFTAASSAAFERGLVLVDTKLELGRRQDNTLVLADEVLTPDSSRYWDAGQARATPRGQTPPSYDKQIVRDYLETLDWNKRPPPPPLPADIVQRTAERYQELAKRLRGPSRIG